LAQTLGVKRNRKQADIVIRYGIPAREDLKIDYRGKRVVNKIEAIRQASNKYYALKKITEAQVCTPRCSTKISEMDRSKIIFGRDFYHSKGSDIVVYQPRQEIRLHDYYIEYVKPRAEYRYHVAFGKVILATKKVLAEGETDDTLIRNHQDGKWRQVTCVETPRFSEDCIKAVKCLGLDFGSVDFIYCGGGARAIILEVNTASGLEVENRLEAYTKAFEEKLL
jgi:glutathione synthase/RimK-type ligase-like ATP-grasp enzyme